MRHRYLQSAVLACCLAAAAPAQAEPETRREEPVMEGLVAHTPEPATEGDIQRYAAREGASPSAENYEAGDAVLVIGASAATLVLAVVLLVVLL